MAQLVERSLAIPEVPGLNPVIGKKFIEHLFTVNCIEETEIKKKGMAHFKKNNKYLRKWTPYCPEFQLFFTSTKNSANESLSPLSH